jgi:ABC-type uncharacterized transport system auxiliary subunit
LSERPPENVRWFRPLADPVVEGADIRSDVIALRIRSVRAPASLGERIAHRDSPTEVGFYEALRWTDPPAKLVHEALERELFVGRGVPRAVSERSAVLDVDVTAFEETRAGKASNGFVAVRVRLGDGHDHVLLERTFSARSPVTGRGDGPELADAVRAALARVARDVGVQVLLRLGGTVDHGPG